MSANYPIEIDVNEVNTLMQSGEEFMLVDVREMSEYVTASIGGSVLIPMAQLQTSLGQLEPYRDKRIVVHCHHGMRSLRAAMTLRSLGFAGAQSMAGGIDEWSTTINPQVPQY